MPRSGRPRAAAPTAPSLPGCSLPALADPRLAGALPGLAFTEGRLTPVPASFGCCSGSGMRLLPDCDTSVRCTLGERLRQVRLLIEKHLRQHGETGRPLAQALATSRNLGAVLQRLAALSLQREARGLTFAAEEGVPKLVSVWAVALAAAWRFGLTPHVVTLGTPGRTALLPPPGAPAPHLVCIESAAGLWDQQTADQLDVLVGYCYGSMTPLFLDLVLPAAPVAAPAVGPQQARLGIQQRIQAHKARSSLSLLTADCLSKISGVTDGLAPWIAAEQSRRAAEKAAPRPRRRPHTTP